MKLKIIAFMGITGFVIGLMIPSLISDSKDSSYCANIDRNMTQIQKFNGSFACYPPGSIKVNLSEDVRESSDLKCVCRIINDKGVRLYPVTLTDQ